MRHAPRIALKGVLWVVSIWWRCPKQPEILHGKVNSQVNTYRCIVALFVAVSALITVIPSSLSAQESMGDLYLPLIQSQPPPPPSRIVFERSQTVGNRWIGDIYTMNPDGSDQIRLTDSSSWNGRPDWSPDGRKIVFVSGRDGNNNIYIMNADGTGEIQLTDDLGQEDDPAWSPDGSKIVFNRGLEMRVMNTDGIQPISSTVYLGLGSRPDWSPDGSKIVYTIGRDLFVINADGTDKTSLKDDRIAEHDATWSPDGSKIAFWSIRNDERHIYVINVDGTNETELTVTDPPAGDRHPSWR